MAGGRPTKYREEYAEQAYKLCLLGHTDADLAEFFEVSEQTINTWKKSHSGFLESVTRGKEVADAEVAASFHKRAVGYQYTETHSEATKEGDIRLSKEIVKEVPPDPGAALNWLKNRQPAKWRDKHDHELSGPGGEPIESKWTVEFVNATPEDKPKA